MPASLPCLFVCFVFGKCSQRCLENVQSWHTIMAMQQSSHAKSLVPMEIPPDRKETGKHVSQWKWKWSRHFSVVRDPLRLDARAGLQQRFMDPYFLPSSPQCISLIVSRTPFIVRLLIYLLHLIKLCRFSFARVSFKNSIIYGHGKKEPQGCKVAYHERNSSCLS